MNAIRQILTPDSSGNVQIQVPIEFRQKAVEVIVMPIGEETDSLDLLTVMDYIGFKAKQRGLTPEILDDLLREE
ncbi:hypothetical protein [Larkinella sp.]|uniref:hypothetical protein n=1 Tax=Larkinella sp. TaxID=2034517 RepID=UPI003BAAC8E9